MAKPSRGPSLRIIRAWKMKVERGARRPVGVAPSTAIDLVSEWRSTGACEAGAQGGDRRSARIEGHAAEILSLVKATPDTTWPRSLTISSKSTASASCRACSGGSSIATTSRSKKTSHASEQDRPDVAAERAAWKASQPEIDIPGWCSSTRREPPPKWRGAMVVRLMASAVSQRSHMAIARRRPSSVRSGRPADCADGPRRSHGWPRVRGLRDASSRADARAGRHRGDGQSRGTQAGRGRPRNRGGGCLAPLSAALLADLNPIEMAFAKLKAALRKAAARSIEALDDAIAHALAAFTAQECLNFFAAAGYDRVDRS